MKLLYTPWRSLYAKSVSGSKDPNALPSNCVFCTQLHENSDEKYHILKRFKHCYVVLNRYPYNAGHLMIIPFEHKAALDQLSAAARGEIMELTTQSITAMQKLLNTEGVNVGLNLGRAAGAGIPAHLHVHVLPRWIGDTNFLPTLADTKTISFDLNDIYQQLKPYFQNITL